MQYFSTRFSHLDLKICLYGLNNSRNSSWPWYWTGGG